MIVFCVYDCHCLPMALKNTTQGVAAVTDKKKKKKKKKKTRDDHGHRFGNWRELYDTMSGEKSWYNTRTKKRTDKDPFW